MFRKVVLGLAIVAVVGTAAAAVWVGEGSAQTGEEVFFGGDDDVAFAQRLWRNLAEARLVDPNAVIQEMSVNGRRRGHIWRNYSHGY